MSINLKDILFQIGSKKLENIYHYLLLGKIKYFGLIALKLLLGFERFNRPLFQTTIYFSMSSNPDVLFAPPNHLRQFGALGYLLGTFVPNHDEDIISFIRGQLITPDGREFKASIKKKDWDRLTKKENFTEDSQFYWRGYFQTTKQGTLTKIQLLRPLFNLPSSIDASGETLSEPTDLFQVRGRIERILKTAFVVRVERNEQPTEGQEKSRLWNPFLITIQGTLPDPSPSEKFGELLCLREGECLRLKKATLMTDEMVLESEKNRSDQTNKSSSKSRVTPSKKENNKTLKTEETSPTITQSPSRESPIIMINGKQPEMTVKFNERPDVPSEGKKVTLQVTGENGIVVQAELNRKTLAKHLEKMESFDDWVGALSGKVSQISLDGVVTLEAAGVQVFEKKQKAKTPEQESKNTESPT